MKKDLQPVRPGFRPDQITDYRTRYLLACESLDSTKEAYAITVFERVFKEFGLPDAIRTDNGIPFASRTAMFGLSRLSVWWLRLGIAIQRIKTRQPTECYQRKNSLDLRALRLLEGSIGISYAEVV